jgi:hypothetical protein
MTVVLTPHIPRSMHEECDRDLEEARAIARRYRWHRHSGDCRNGMIDRRCAVCRDFDALQAKWAKDDDEP